LFDATGRLTGAVNMLVDISEGKRAEETLAEREAQLALFVEHAPAAIVMFDRDMRYLAVSRRFVVDYLPPGTQLIGRSHYEAFPNIPQRWRDIHARVLAGEEMSQDEDQYTRYDGRIDWVRWSMAPWRKANGDIGGALLFAEVITEQVEARRALAESEERLRLAQMRTGIGIWDWNLRTGKLAWTTELEALFGLQPGTVQRYADFRERVHPDDIAAVEAQRDAAVHSRKTFNAEYRILRTDGQIRWMSVMGGAVYDEVTGEPVRIIGNNVDITARKESEGKLKKSERAFRELLGALPAALYVTDADGRITYSNQAAVELWGKRPELGKDRWYDLARFYCADGKPVNLRQCPTAVALRKGKSVRGCEAIIERADGTRIPILPYPTPLRDAAGAVVGVVNMMVDISARQKAERTLAECNAQLALAGKAALVGTFAYESDLETMSVSEGYCAIHGLPPGTTETTRTHLLARVHPDDLEGMKRFHAQTFNDKRDVYTQEFRIARANGEVRWIESRGTISYDSNGQPQRLIGINIDVTDRKQTEALLNESKTRLSDALAAGQVVAFEWDAASGRTKRSDNADRIIGLVEDGGFLKHVHADDRVNFEAHVHGLSRANPSYALTFRFVRPDGRQAWLEETAKGEFDDTGHLLRIKGLTRDITERKELEDHKNTLISELDHRVKNVLALVLTVASRTRETSSSMTEFVAALDSRIKSMASTQELLSHRRWRGIPLAELVHRELSPYATGNNTRIAGHNVMLSAEASQALAMVFHELATNAAKFGALSTRSGHVSVCWTFRQNGHAESWLCIDWEESGGPNVVPPKRSGFGTSVVRELVPYELGGSADLAHLPEGVRCKLDIPAQWLSTNIP
jgi:PAS domain S-box-containing protein